MSITIPEGYQFPMPSGKPCWWNKDPEARAAAQAMLAAAGELTAVFRGRGIPSRRLAATFTGVPVVYCILDADDFPCYVGSTVNLRARLNDHRSGANDFGRHQWFAVACESEPAARALETRYLRMHLPYRNKRRSA